MLIDGFQCDNCHQKSWHIKHVIEVELTQIKIGKKTLFAGSSDEPLHFCCKSCFREWLKHILKKEPIDVD